MVQQVAPKHQVALDEVERLRARIQDALDASWGDRGGERSASDALDDVRHVLAAALDKPKGK